MFVLKPQQVGICDEGFWYTSLESAQGQNDSRCLHAEIASLGYGYVLFGQMPVIAQRMPSLLQA